MMFWYGPGMSNWGWGISAFSSLVFWVLVVVAIVVLVRHFATRPSGSSGGYSAPGSTPPQSTPEQLLAERFARGEIDTDEYWERLAVLREGRDGKQGKP